MKTTAWKDLNHKVSPERREQLKLETVAELDRMGFASLRKARQQTQVELADKLGIDQASVSAIENRSDLLLSTLAKYVRALGGDVEIRAVFPEATFNLEPLLTGEAVPAPVSNSPGHRTTGRKSLGGRRRAVLWRAERVSNETLPPACGPHDQLAAEFVSCAKLCRKNGGDFDQD